MSNLTPLMKQYWDIKSLHQDKVLLFRMGDFFEMFHDDAVKAAPIAGIALTSRNKKSADETPMCGVPHHSVAGPINKILAAGLKVAICDQLEDPKLAKGLVKRGVTRVLTPGMVYDSDTLDETRPHYLVSIDSESISFLDSTTGEAFYFHSTEVKELLRFLDLLPVAEIVIAESDFALLGNKAEKFVVTIFNSLETETHPLLPPGSPNSAARLIKYVQEMNSSEALQTISPFVKKDLENRLELTNTVLRHLEVFSTYRGEGAGSLFHAMNRSQTSAGSRMFRQWLSFPLRDAVKINARLDQVQFWREHLLELKRLRQILGQMGDIERRLGKISQPTCNGRDLLALASSVQAGLSSLEVVQSLPVMNVNAVPKNLLRELAYKIEQTLVEEPPLAVKQGYLIRLGVNAELDELIQLSTHSHDLVARMEVAEKEATGISSLKIRYNNVFGYYIEITNTHKDKAPARYQRKQTLTNAERYCTDELVELERKVLSAQTKRSDLEFEFFDSLRKEILNNSQSLLNLAHVASELDVLSSLAWLSIEEKYVRPQFSNQNILNLKASRHAVVEQMVKKNFVTNDISLKPQSCMLLTGPNMAGKSTLMRQVALSSMMAQMGSYVPADEAVLPVFDAIYTRIGASDQLSEGLSTFMVEMTETSEMLKNASKNSLVILDEVGRGTSTFDGMCLAQSILEYLLTEVKCHTFFATHYHELTALDQSFPLIINNHMTVAEKNGEIKFLHTLAKGPALKSYGVQVAELAGLPTSVTKRAKNLLRELESRKVTASSQMSLMDLMDNSQDEDSFNDIKEVNLSPEVLNFLDEVKKLAVMQMTPLEALNHLAKVQEKAGNLSIQ